MTYPPPLSNRTALALSAWFLTVPHEPIKVNATDFAITVSGAKRANKPTYSERTLLAGDQYRRDPSEYNMYVLLRCVTEQAQSLFTI